jgi:hypothetical protein
MPYTPTLPFRSTRKQRGNCVSLILVAVLFYHILQIVVFVCSQSTQALSRVVRDGLSTPTLLFCSSREPVRMQLPPILAIVFLYRIL